MPVVLGILTEATTWLTTCGTDQWQVPLESRRSRVEQDAAAHTLFLVADRGIDVATVTVDEFADADFWQPADDPASALYVHRMAVRRSAAGRGIGSAMLDWAGRRACLRGRTRLRLDAWRTNHGLHVYYTNLGFEHVRDVEPPADRPRGSGMLFQRDAGYHDPLGPQIVQRWPVRRARSSRSR